MPRLIDAAKKFIAAKKDAQRAHKNAIKSDGVTSLKKRIEREKLRRAGSNEHYM